MPPRYRQLRSAPISEPTLQAIRSIPLIDVVGSVVKLRRRGRQFVGLCPFHPERTASFGVDPEKNVFYCHGCAAGGDIINFIERLEHCDFREAVNILAGHAGISIENGAADRRRLAWRDELRTIDEHLNKILSLEQRYCSVELARLRYIIRRHSLENLPANIFDHLRRTDARYTLIALSTETDALDFLCCSAAEQEQRIDAALEDGYVRSGKNYWEIPL